MNLCLAVLHRAQLYIKSATFDWQRCNKSPSHTHVCGVPMQAIFIPFVGILGNEFNRVILIAIGSLWWGAMSIGFGFAHSLVQVIPWLPTH